RLRRFRGTKPRCALAHGGAGERRYAPDRTYRRPPPRGERGAECRDRWLAGDLMPDLGFYHPIVIHFAIGLLAGGVLLRGLSLTRRGAFAGPAAVTLILLATAATLVAAQSGEDAHVAVEAAPGIAAVVRAHQQWGERTRNVVLLVGGLELLTLALRGRSIVRTMSFVSAGFGLLAFVSILQ